MKRKGKEVAASSRMVSRRALVVGAAQLGIVGALGYRLKTLQLDQMEEFRLLAEENRINMRLLPPARGMIFDINGLKVADNEQNYRAVIVREEAKDVDAVLAKLQDLIGLDDRVIEKAKEEMYRRSAFVPVTVAEFLTWEDIAKININTPALPGVTAEVGLSRSYPWGADLAHVVGYVGPVSDYDLSRIEDKDPLLQIPKFQIGKTGVENKLEQTLRGSAGTLQIEVNAVGRVMRELDRKEGDPGEDVQLTLDARLQSYVQARLDGESAGVVVMDLENGDMRAIASAPAFDPNLFVRGISSTNWRALNEDKYRPLAAKAVQGTYPPGSTFKMVTALAAMEAGVVGPNDSVYCPGHMDVYNIRFHCWKRGGHGRVPLLEAIRQSCDVYFYDICQKVGIDRIAETARKLGLGVRHDLPVSAVAEGVAPDTNWKRTTYDEPWRLGDTVNASIGQGYVLASPMQLAVMAGRIATGRSVTPRLIKSIGGVAQPSGRGEPLDLNPANLERIRDAMDATSNSSRGTAFRSRIVAEGMHMAGKTGTSQVRRITAEERAAGVTSNADLPWERRDHALFVCYAPVENPRFAVSVIVEHGGGGSTAAAPIARDVMLQALYDGDPPLEAYPPEVHEQIAEQQRRIRSRIAPGARGNMRT